MEDLYKKGAPFRKKEKTKTRRNFFSLWFKGRTLFQWKARQFQSQTLPANPVIVSLTSYPKRFKTLHLTLKSLLTQTIRPTRVILWVAHEDESHLPGNVRDLTATGLEIRECEDIRSYKKIIPSLRTFPNTTIVTADDDSYYWPNWLEELLLTADRFPGDVIAHRLHRLQLNDGVILPYKQWSKKIKDQTPHPHNFATGVGGVLYPPGCFHEDVLEAEKFMQLCPDADDVWLYWMVRLSGRYERHSGTCWTPIPWGGSQAVSLWHANKTNNDEQIKKMVEAYGLPS